MFDRVPSVRKHSFFFGRHVLATFPNLYLAHYVTRIYQSMLNSLLVFFLSRSAKFNYGSLFWPNATSYDVKLNRTSYCTLYK